MNSLPEWIERTSRFRIRVEGPDRHKFLHNLTTNEIKRLAENTGCEVFVTSPQGKTLAFVQIHNLGDSLLLRGDAASLESLQPHLAKYGMFDEITLTDLTDCDGQNFTFSGTTQLWTTASDLRWRDQSILLLRGN